MAHGWLSSALVVVCALRVGRLEKRRQSRDAAAGVDTPSAVGRGESH